VRRRGDDDVGPLRAGLDSREARRRVDLHGAHAVRLDEDRALELRRQRRRAVAGALRGNGEALLAGEVDDGLDVGDGLGLRDRDRPLVDGEVPRLPGGVPAVVVRDGQISREPLPQVGDVHCRQRRHVHPRVSRRGRSQ
jgi:hypothetical protein